MFFRKVKTKSRIFAGAFTNLCSAQVFSNAMVFFRKKIGITSSNNHSIGVCPEFTSRIYRKRQIVRPSKEIERNSIDLNVVSINAATEIL
jgi:hypothetical protein